eukprot:5783701-Pleurochrysis_carterae.AAC.1
MAIPVEAEALSARCEMIRIKNPAGFRRIGCEARFALQRARSYLGDTTKWSSESDGRVSRAGCRAPADPDAASLALARVERSREAKK